MTSAIDWNRASLSAPERQVVEVLRFVKQCPTCGGPLRVEQRFSGACWWDCATCGRVESRSDDAGDVSW